MRAAKSRHFDSFLADYEKHTRARQQTNAAKCLRLALKFHAKQWFNVRDEKRIVDDEALRNFYSEQFGLQKELENTQVQTRMHRIPDGKLVVEAPMKQETSLNSPATSSRNI